MAAIIRSRMDKGIIAEHSGQGQKQLHSGWLRVFSGEEMEEIHLVRVLDTHVDVVHVIAVVVSPSLLF